MMDSHPIADIPGLIEGASKGVGLGLKFLKHIEKTKILVHCIDITVDNPQRAYETVRKEFQQYNPQLLEKPEIIFLNKTDLVDEQKIADTPSMFKSPGMTVFAGSTHDKESIMKLKHLLTDRLAQLRVIDEGVPTRGIL